MLKKIMESEYNLDEHIYIINQALCEDKLSKLHIIEHLNHMIYSDKITPNDYKLFEKLKINSLNVSSKVLHATISKIF
jgi:hypothetical protein